MIPKPDACIGCPFYDKGEYFTPDLINPDSEVLFIAQNPGPDEEAGHKLIKRHYHGYGITPTDEYDITTPQPLIGATGQLFDNKFLPVSGLQRDEVSLANAIRCRPGKDLGLDKDSLPVIAKSMKAEGGKAIIANALSHCKTAHLRIPDKTKLIVTLGAYSLFQLTGMTDVLNWRGYALDYKMTSNGEPYEMILPNSYNYLVADINIFVTMHIAALFKGENKKFYHATLQDFGKIKRILNKTWPLALPTWSDIPPDKWPTYSVFDTEYDIKTNELIRWSLCDTDNKLYCVEEHNTPYDKIPIKPGSTVLMQNALADIRYLSNIVDFRYVKIEDLMLAHSVLYTGEPHSLNYIASIFGAFNRYKHLSKDDPALYSALDAYEPMYIWRTGIIPEFKKDHQSWNIYKEHTLPLIDIIDKAQRTGQAINNDRLIKVKETINDRLDEINQEAKEITGDVNFNIGGSKKLKAKIYG